ncbi:hypothetical protein OGAPHI_007056 [Ogataea philodendri]|uniref:Protein-lysine N-methyltransferase EFM5 n=1 Tax=Ogataea philodendri TaxID=1378263 RepID=A0A9P8T035_9ASCO|nr:uncharacterized protein OGAPHI_007056 [Ogataea philodendri]KAH3660470.1 hypothetical protein OGAPHI_007056 [Ogataea philodendri]
METALTEFKNEEKERLERFTALSHQAEEDFTARSTLSIDDFKEDWQLSQFWYSDETANILADELLDGADSETTICVVSAPSVYAAIKLRDPLELPTKRIFLLEFDRRFEVLSGSKYFGFFDYNHPLELPEHLVGKCDRLLIDPPFLEEDCQRKSAIAAKSLLCNDKSQKTKAAKSRYRLMSCTGERMADVVRSCYPDLKMTSFFPEHKNGLSNEFRCYASFEGNSWSFSDS